MLVSKAINRVRQGDIVVTEYVRQEDGSFHIETSEVVKFTFTGDFYILDLVDGTGIVSDGIKQVLMEVQDE